MPSPARLLNALWPFAAVVATSTYDYVIVGGGATGLSLAVRLSEDPMKTVVVLEAGNSPNITNLRLNANNFGTANDWQFVTVPQVDVGNRIQAQVQGKVLGGGSAINSGMYLRGNKQEYNALESLGAVGWNWDSMFAAVKKSEYFHPPSQAKVDTFNMTWEPAFHGFDGPISVAIQAVNVSRFFPDFAVPTLKNLGHEMNIDPNGGFHNGPTWDFLTILPDSSTRSYAVSGYCACIVNLQVCVFNWCADLSVINRTNLHVMTESQGSKILWSSTKTKGLVTASGVEYISVNETGVQETRTIARSISPPICTLTLSRIDSERQECHIKQKHGSLFHTYHVAP
ncbi:hypothetical protein C8R45DRAFT_837614 [Mycena sanguinolenta]|nr:hypothetical protein C8R45DRAFT_837614 [Mycena sanguinolenta]